MQTETDYETIIADQKKTISALKKEIKELKIEKEFIFNRYEHVVGKKLEISQELTNLRNPAVKIPLNLSKDSKK